MCMSKFSLHLYIYTDIYISQLNIRYFSLQTEGTGYADSQTRTLGTTFHTQPRPCPSTHLYREGLFFYVLVTVYLCGVHRSTYPIIIRT